MSRASIFKYFSIFAQIAGEWEALGEAAAHEEHKLANIRTRIKGRRAIIRQSVEFEE